MIEVKALSAGYYGTRRRSGDTFSIADEKDFSANWMEKVVEEKVVEVEQTETKPKKKTTKKRK